MAIRNNSNPDTEALGLDVEALVGRRLDEVRSLLAAHADVALLVGHEPVPAGWPEEIVTRDEAEDSLVWSYRDADGAWQEIYVFGAARKSPTDSVPAHIYTRRPADPSEASVRLIVKLAFRPDGTCEMASASSAEDRMILAIKQARRVRQPRPKGQKKPSPLPPNRARSPIEDLERLMGLPPPAMCVEAEDFITESDGRLVIGIWASPQPLFVVFDGGRNPRLAAVAEPGREPRLSILTDAGEWPPVEIGPGGLRVVPRCGMESEEAFLDFYAAVETGHRVIDPTGAERAVRILMVAGPCLSSAFPDAKLSARIVVLASPEAQLPGSREPGPRDLVVRPDGQVAEVRASSGKVVFAMRTTFQEQPGAFIIDGVVTRG